MHIAQNSRHRNWRTFTTFYEMCGVQKALLIRCGILCKSMNDVIQLFWILKSRPVEDNLSFHVRSILYWTRRPNSQIDWELLLEKQSVRRKQVISIAYLTTNFCLNDWNNHCLLYVWNVKRTAMWTGKRLSIVTKALESKQLIQMRTNPSISGVWTHSLDCIAPVNYISHNVFVCVCIMLRCC